jgi:GNAT superfamily N-acetyltransferase
MPSPPKKAIIKVANGAALEWYLHLPSWRRRRIRQLIDARARWLRSLGYNPEVAMQSAFMRFTTGDDRDNVAQHGVEDKTGLTFKPLRRKRNPTR